MRAQVEHAWDSASAQLLRSSQMDPGIAAFAANVSASRNMPASYVNAATVNR